MSDSVRPHRRCPSGSTVPGILQARTLEWVAISFSKAWKWKVKVKSLSRVRLLATPWTAAHQAPPSMRFSRQESWSGVPKGVLYTHSYCQLTSPYSQGQSSCKGGWTILSLFWMVMCPARIFSYLKCKKFYFCEEKRLDIKEQPAVSVFPSSIVFSSCEASQKFF